jgi:ABC-type phosphate transport system auxiliary subunit
MVSVPLVAILGVIVFIAWRFMGLRVWMAIVCLLFGFFLATTSAAPDIRRLVPAIVRAMTGS